MRALTVLFVVVGDVENGGFEACMYNSSGDWVAEGISAARLIGASDHAALLERFVDVGMGGNPAMSQRKREERLEGMNAAETTALEALDDAFYALSQIDELLTEHVNQHPSEFFRD